MPTLWEILTKRKKEEVALELQHYNPLKVKVGTVINILDNEYKDLNFIVKSVEDYQRLPAKNNNHFCDYNVTATSAKGNQSLKIRLVPNEDSSIGHDVLVLSKYDSMQYDKTFEEEVLNSPTLQFDINLENEVLSYWRINDVDSPYKIKVTLLKDTDGDGKVETEEIQTSTIILWDYWRDVNEENGIQTREYLYVEMTDKDKYFTLWRGKSLLPQNVVVF
jgi:hypothetical protein